MSNFQRASKHHSVMEAANDELLGPPAQQGLPITGVVHALQT